MHFDVVLSVFIHPCAKCGGELNSVFVQSWRGCLCACALDVCAENFSHSARLLLQKSRAFYMLASCVRIVLISSPAWDVRLNENARVCGNTKTDIMWKCGQCQNKGAFLYYRYRYFTRGIDALYRHTLYRYIDPYRWIVTPLELHFMLQ